MGKKCSDNINSLIHCRKGELWRFVVYADENEHKTEVTNEKTNLNISMQLNWAISAMRKIETRI